MAYDALGHKAKTKIIHNFAWDKLSFASNLLLLAIIGQSDTFFTLFITVTYNECAKTQMKHSYFFISIFKNINYVNTRELRD